MQIATPSVELLARTSAKYTFPSEGIHLVDMEPDLDSSEAEDVMEFAGRSCYQSFGKPNPATESNKDYMANILAQGHESVLEHASATFYITGVSRALTHELIRHRHLSYSQLSQRFVDESDAAIVIPPAIRDNEELTALVVKSAEKDLKKYTKLVDKLTDSGLMRKQAREAARAVLPNSIETRIVVTGNYRAWRDVLKKRLSVHADAEIREVSEMILEELNNLAHNALQDSEEWNID